MAGYFRCNQNTHKCRKRYMQEESAGGFKASSYVVSGEEVAYNRNNVEE